MTSKVVVDGVYVFESPTNNIVGTAKCTIYGEISFFVKIFNGKNGIFAGLPTVWNKAKNEGKGAYEPSFYLSESLREELNNSVKEKYDEKASSKPAASIPKTSSIPASSVPVPHTERAEEDFDDDDIPF